MKLPPLTVLVTVVLSAHSIFASSYEGIYKGTFSGVSSGEFVAMVESDNAMTVWSYDVTFQEGFKSYLTVNSNGSFSGVIGITAIAGNINGNSVSGTGSNIYGSISFGAVRKPDTGIANHFVGYYEGQVTSNLHPNYNCDFIISADGEGWFYSYGSFGENGGWGTVGSSGSFTVTDIGGITYTGTVSERNFGVTASFSGGGEVGTVTADRITPFTHSPPIDSYSPTIAINGSSSLQVETKSHVRRSYTVYKSTNLVHWTLVHTYRGTGADISHPDSITSGPCFYRIEVDE